ncbi:AEC family transporter [Kocuria palustris]|uniref:AEC family transporter n=1 Tax=Kocuria palustris TaxID=71999 RepID=UPI00246952F5|nr:AEC family transporter [Kocuria palustris]MDH5151410.1 AEC family transporter [Kocuria palustris]
MAGVLAGFAVIWIIILVGAVVSRAGILGDAGQRSLSAFSFWVASPCLLFLTVSGADVSQIFSAPLLVALVSAWATASLWWGFAFARRALRRRDQRDRATQSLPSADDGSSVERRGAQGGRARLGSVIMSGQSASMVNSANLGIPLTTFVLGDASAVVPVILFQLAIYTPIYLALMDIAVLGRRPNPLSLLRSVATNPMILGSLLGVVFSATGWHLPTVARQPIELISGAAIPCMLAAFGMSLVSHRPLQGTRAHRQEVALLSALKLIVQPVLAWLFGLALGLDPAMLYGVVLMAALPTAQNVYVAAVRYRSAEAVTRDVVLVTSAAAMGTMAVVALLLA